MAARLATLLAAILLGGGSIAHAQPAEPAGPAATAPDPTTAAYEAAFDALVRGDLPAAGAGFRDVVARATDPDRVTRARELARLVDQLIARKVRVVPSGVTTEAEKDDQDDGRTSLVVWSTILALYGGVVIIDDANIEDFRVGILTVTATTAAGLFGSYFATDGHPVTGAEADMYSLGMLAGAANAGLLIHPVGLATSSERGQTTVFASSAVTAFAGLGFARELHPTRGQVAFAGSLGLLGAASAGLGIGVVNPRLDGDQWLVSIAAGTDVGLGLGLGLSPDLDWSIARGRLVQLGVLLGGLTGLATGALITGTDTGSDTTARTLSVTTLAGMWGGFGLAVKLTSGMRADRTFGRGGMTTTLAPLTVRGGGGVALVGSF